MSSGLTEFPDDTIVTDVSGNRTFPRVAVMSYLSGKRIADCYREKNTLESSDELDILVGLYGLIELGTESRRRYVGAAVVEAEVRRATDQRCLYRVNRLTNTICLKLIKENKGSQDGKRTAKQKGD